MCLSTLAGGGGNPSQVQVGGTPSQVWMGGTQTRSGFGYIIPGLDGGGVPHFRSGWGVPHPRSRQGGTPGYPLSRTGWGTHLGWVPPHLDLGWGTFLDLGWGMPLSRTGWGTSPPGPGMGYPPPNPPPSRTGWGTLHLGWGNPPPHQETEQHSEHLLSGRRYASCVHAGGLSCFEYTFSTMKDFLLPPHPKDGGR